MVHHPPVSLIIKQHMYKVLNNDTAVAVTETINEAIQIVRSLEAGLDRLREHSPYTIVKA